MADPRDSYFRILSHPNYSKSLKMLQDAIKWQESHDRNIYQKGGGPGAGHYQVEQESRHPRASDTSRQWVQRAHNFADKTRIPAPKWLYQGKIDPMDPDFTSLSEDEQDQLFEYNMHMAPGSYKIMEKLMNAQDPADRFEAVNEYWRDIHKIKVKKGENIRDEVMRFLY